MLCTTEACIGRSWSLVLLDKLIAHMHQMADTSGASHDACMQECATERELCWHLCMTMGLAKQYERLAQALGQTCINEKSHPLECRAQAEVWVTESIRLLYILSHKGCDLAPYNPPNVPSNCIKANCSCGCACTLPT